MTQLSLHSPVILDIAGLSLTAVDKKRLKHPLTGGVILFARIGKIENSLLRYASRSKKFVLIYSSASITKAGVCSALKRMALPTCLLCVIWASFGSKTR